MFISSIVLIFILRLRFPGHRPVSHTIVVLAAAPAEAPTDALAAAPAAASAAAPAAAPILLLLLLH